MVIVVVAPMHTLLAPVIAPGEALTVTVVDTLQLPDERVYVTVVVPADTPVTTPFASTVVTALLLLLQLPPAGLLLSVVVLPTHTDVVPVIAAGLGHTENDFGIE